MTVYILILMTLTGGTVNTTEVAATFAGKEACEATGKRWDNAGIDFRHLCLPTKLELP